MISDAEWEKVIDELVRTLKHKHPSQLDPYEWYHHKMVGTLLKDTALFKKRFLRGYHILMGEKNVR